MSNKIAIQYGCGWCAPDEWLNYDSSPTLRFERLPLLGKFSNKNPLKFPDNVKYGDIVKGLPLTNDSCDYVYCSHVLEHLSLVDFRVAISNTFNILKTDGIFRFVVPDLEFLVNQYISDRSSDSAIKFLKNSYLGRENRSKSIINFLYDFFGNSNHLWMWDYPSIVDELGKLGFRDIRRAYFNDSGHKIFNSVEDITRWNDSLGIQCIK